jgi:hypothetical protein
VYKRQNLASIFCAKTFEQIKPSSVIIIHFMGK